MNLIQFITPFVTNPLTVYLVVALLFFWALWSSVGYWRGTHTASTSFRDATAKLSAVSSASAFPIEFETVSSDLGKDRILGNRWKDYVSTLALPKHPGRPIHSTARAEDWFSLEILRSPQIGLDPRYHAVLPNLLVGAGLLFTFLGLAVALNAAGGIVEGDSADRNVALKRLLDTASFKFVTSLAGLLLSILYTIMQKRMLRQTEKTIDAFLVTLEGLTPALTHVSLKIEANDLLERQLTQLETFSNDLAVGLSEVMDTSFNRRLGQHIEPLTSAITRLSEGMSSNSEGALQSMLDGFVDRLQGGAGAQVNVVAETLSGLGSQLAGLQTGFSEAAVKMASSADAMANRMSNGAEALQSRIDTQAEASAARLSAQVEAMVTELRELAHSSRATGEDAMEALAAQIGTAALAFEATATRVSKSLEAAATSTGGALGKGAEEAVDRIAAATEGMRSQLAGLQTGFSEMAIKMASSADAMASRMSDGATTLQSRIDTQAEASAARLSVQVEAMVSELRALAQSSRSTGEEAMGKLAAQIGTAALAFETTATRVSESLETAATSTGGALGKGAEAAVDRIAAATEGMRIELQAMMFDLKSALGQAGETLREGTVAGGAALQGSVEAAGHMLAAAMTGAADRLTQAGASASVALERGGDTAAMHLDTAGKAFGDRAEDLAREITALARAGEAIGQQFGELDRATREVIAPLTEASADLKAAGQSSRAAAEPLVQSAQNSAKALDQVAATAQQLEAAGQRAGTLIESLNAAAQRFEGVDKELAGTLRGLQDGLRGFTNEISGFVGKTDQNLAQAAGHVAALVKELQSTIEDFNDAKPARTG